MVVSGVNQKICSRKTHLNQMVTDIDVPTTSAGTRDPGPRSFQVQVKHTEY